MKKEEIYAKLRDSENFADSRYFDYAWLMLSPKDFEPKLFQSLSEVYTNKMDAETFIDFVKKAKQVSIEPKENGEVLRISSMHIDDKATLQFLTKRIKGLLKEYAKAFKFLYENQEFLILTDDEEMFNVFIKHFLEIKVNIYKGRYEDLLSWKSRIKEFLETLK